MCCVRQHSGVIDTTVPQGGMISNEQSEWLKKSGPLCQFILKARQTHEARAMLILIAFQLCSVSPSWLLSALSLLCCGCDSRQWGHSCGAGSPLYPKTGACGHKENQSGKMPDQHGWTIGKYVFFPQPCVFFFATTTFPCDSCCYFSFLIWKYVSVDALCIF